MESGIFGKLAKKAKEIIMKYIVFQDFGGKEVPFIFPYRVEFIDMREQMPYARVISCGYVVLENGGFTCSGGDAELGLSARPEDVQLIATAFSPEWHAKETSL